MPSQKPRQAQNRPQVREHPAPTTNAQTIDNAALAFAGVAATISLLTGTGAWTLTSSLVGMVIFVVVLAYYRRAEKGTVRGGFQRLAFGAVLALATTLIASYFRQGDVSSLTTEAEVNAAASTAVTKALYIAIPVGVIAVAIEPWVLDWLKIKVGRAKRKSGEG